MGVVEKSKNKKRKETEKKIIGVEENPILFVPHMKLPFNNLPPFIKDISFFSELIILFHFRYIFCV